MNMISNVGALSALINPAQSESDTNPYSSMRLIVVILGREVSEPYVVQSGDASSRYSFVTGLRV